MTTIVYHDGVMYADSLAYQGRYDAPIGTKSKIYVAKDGTAIGVSSSCVGAGEQILRWYEDGQDPKGLPAGSPSDCQILMVKRDGSVFYAKDSLCFSGPLTGDFWAIGSGDRYALGAYRAGVSARTALEIAISIDPFSGLPVNAVVVVK